MTAARCLFATIALLLCGPALAQTADGPELFAQPQAAPPAAPLPIRGERQMSFAEWDRLPHRVKYIEGMGVPAWYVKVKKSTVPAWSTGISLLGGAYLFSTLAATVDAEGGGSELGGLFVPVFGPWIALGTPTAWGPRRPTESWILVFDGLVQGTGAALLIYGLLHKRVFLQKLPWGTFSPMVLRQGAGMRAIGRF